MRLRTFIFLTLCLLLVVVLAPPAGRPSGTEIRSMSVGQPQEWSGLQASLDARTWWYATVAVEHPVPPRPRAPRSSHRTGRGYSSTAECIAVRENGGDYGRSSNPTHFGKYQYDRQTWAAHGGDPSTWGSASPEEQERVFAQGTAQYGYGAWTPYDGC